MSSSVRFDATRMGASAKGNGSGGSSSSSHCIVIGTVWIA